MSDEPTPPPPRPKPRLSADDDPAATSNAPADDSSADLLRLRLKPKSPSAAASSPVPVPLPVPLRVPPPAVPRPPMGVVPPPGAPPVPYIKAPAAVTGKAYVPAAKNSDQVVYRADKWLAVVVIFVLVLLGGIYGLRHFKKSASADATNTQAATPAPVKNPGSAVPGLVEHPTSLPGKTMAKARDMVAARNESEMVQGVAQAVGDEPVPTATPKPSSADDMSDDAADAAPKLPPPPSEQFRAFVLNLRVSGVSQGENARALLNGKMYHEGDLVEAKLNITLQKIDADTKQLIFRDDTGATMPRRY